MDIFQLIGIGIAGAIAAIMLKSYRPELSICIVLVTGAVLLSYILGILDNVLYFIERLIESSGLDKKYFTVILRITGITYITEIASELCRDAGQAAIAVKLEMAGKMFILLLSLPIISGFLEVCINAVNLL